ncbi:hypothetical protein V8E51_018798 [Hyaloscypha variabilis]|jgi:hypothetical protein
MELEISRDSTSLSDIESHAAPSQDCMLQNHGDLSDTHICKGVDSLINVFLDRRFRVTGFLRRDNHADVYSVLCLPSPSERFEARAYDLSGLSPKLRQYRLRSIKRLSNRTVLETRWGGRTIIVYKTGTETIQDKEASERKEPLSAESPASDEAPLVVKNTENERKFKVSSHQKETARIRQLERRQSKRQSKREMKTLGTSEGDSSNAPKTASTTPWPEDEEEDDFYALLYVAFHDPHQVHQKLKPELFAQLRHYLWKPAFDFEDYDEMQIFLKAKQREYVFLLGQQEKLPEVLRSRRDWFERVLKKQSRYPPNSGKFSELQNTLRIANHKLKVVRTVRDVLPRLVEEADGVHRDLRRRLPSVRKKDELENWRAMRDKLKRKVYMYERCLKEVLPASEPYDRMVAQLGAAEKNLEIFETRHSKSLALSVENGLAKHKRLLQIAWKVKISMEMPRQPSPGFGQSSSGAWEGRGSSRW